MTLITSNNFENLTDPVAAVDALLRTGLASLYEELRSRECYVREHEVVNLFTFGHLVPALIQENLDLRQLGIEYPVRQHVQTEREKPRVRKDLVLWPRVGATCWNDSIPLAVIEWKHTSLITPRPRDVEIGYSKDVGWLRRNSDLMRVGYAVLVVRSSEGLTLKSTKVLNGVSDVFACFPGSNIQSTSR